MFSLKTCQRHNAGIVISRPQQLIIFSARALRPGHRYFPSLNNSLVPGQALTSGRAMFDSRGVQRSALGSASHGGFDGSLAGGRLAPRTGWCGQAYSSCEDSQDSLSGRVRLTAVSATQYGNELDGPEDEGEYGGDSEQRRHEPCGEDRPTPPGSGEEEVDPDVAAAWTRAARSAMTRGPRTQPLSEGVLSAAERALYNVSERSPSSERERGDQERTQHPLSAGVIQHVGFTANMTSEELSAGDIGATSGATDDWTDRAAEAAVQYGGGDGGGEVESSRLERGGSAAVEGRGNVGNVAGKVLDAAATAAAKSAYVGIAAGGKVAAAAGDVVHAVGDAVAGAKERVSQAAEYVGSTANDIAERAEEVVAAAALRGEAAVRDFESGAEERARVVREKVRSGAHELVDQGADAMMNVQGGKRGVGGEGEAEERNAARRQQSGGAEGTH